jgi:Catalase
MTDRTPPMTHATGMPVVDNTNIQTAGPRGPALLQDVWLIEKLAHFDREVIPERRMPRAGVPMALSPSPTTSPAIPRQRSSLRSASRRLCSPASRRWRASVARPMLSATSAALP